MTTCVYCASELTLTIQAGFCALDKPYVCWCPASPESGTDRVHEPDWDEEIRRVAYL